MDAGDDARRWLEEIERRLTQRFRAVYLLITMAALFGFGVMYSQRMVHGASLRAAQGSVVALGTSSTGEPTFTTAFVDAEGNWHRETESYGYWYHRGKPYVGAPIEYMYGIKYGDFYAEPRGDHMLKWLFGVPAGLFALFGILAGVVIMREHDTRRALVRGGQRVPLQMPRIGHRHVTLPGGPAGPASFDLWRLEGRVFDAGAGEYVECASDWQQPPPPELDLSRVPPLLVDPAQPRKRWLPVGALRTSGYAPAGNKQAA